LGLGASSEGGYDLWIMCATGHTEQRTEVHIEGYRDYKTPDWGD